MSEMENQIPFTTIEIPGKEEIVRVDVNKTLVAGIPMYVCKNPRNPLEQFKTLSLVDLNFMVASEVE